MKFVFSDKFKITIGLTIVVLALTVAFTRAYASATPPHIAHPLTGQVPLRTLVVNSTADSGDNTHADVGTLRRALVDANNNPGLDRIVFDFPGRGVRTIKIVNYFPDIKDDAGVIVDGLYRADGSLNDDRIEIDASGTHGHYTFHVLSDNNVFEGLVVNGNPDAGGFGLENADNNVFLSNYIGTDPSGTVRKPNHSGIMLTNAHNTVVGGTNGITVGGSCTGDCNLLSGNNFHGMIINTNSANTRVIGNFIGLNASGTASLLNNEDGVLIANAHDNVVGGDTPQKRNYIAGNHVIGVEIGLQNSYNNLIQGNYIGTNSQGIAGVSGNGAGVMLDNLAHDNIVDGNLIAGLGTFGVEVFYDAVRTEIKNNRVGMAATTDTPIGTGSHGIEVQTSGNRIHNNRVAFSQKDGIRVRKGMNNLVSQNSVFQNANFGINLGTDGYTPNDAGDGDAGPNGYQNFPLINSAKYSNGNLTLQGSFNSRPSGRYTLEFFQNPACDVAFGNSVGEGKVYLGSTIVTTDGNGNAGFSVKLSNAPNLGVVTGTATDSQNNSSELSPCRVIQVVSAAPEIPKLLSPTNKQNVTNNPPNLTWQAADSADSYQVTLRQDGKKGTIVERTTTSDTSYTPKPLAGGKTYFWRVTACNSFGCSKSPIFMFVIP